MRVSAGMGWAEYVARLLVLGTRAIVFAIERSDSRLLVTLSILMGCFGDT